MSGYMTPNEWINSADYEGSIYGGLEYGLSEEDINEDEYPRFRKLVSEARNTFWAFERDVNAILDYSEEGEA